MSQEATGEEVVAPGIEQVSTETIPDEGNQASDDPYSSKFDDQQASIDLLGERFDELKDTITQAFQSRQPEQVPLEEEGGDLTEGKVERIVGTALRNHGAAMNNNAQRLSWDDKAKEKFPLHDPKFEKAFRRVWAEQVKNGPMDGTHAKAVYHVAEMTALRIGVTKRSPQTKTTSGEETALSPSPAPPRRSGAAESSILDNDSRVAFYKLKGSKTKEQIEAFKAQLQAKDERRGRV